MNDKQKEEMIITVAERAGIALDTPKMSGFFAWIGETEGMQECLDKLVGTVIEETARYLEPINE